MFGKSITATSVRFIISRFLLFLSGTIKPNGTSCKMEHHHCQVSLLLGLTMILLLGKLAL
jgi:hypothetical protein